MITGKRQKKVFLTDFLNSDERLFNFALDLKEI